MRVLSTFVCILALTALVCAFSVEVNAIPSSSSPSSLHRLKHLITDRRALNEPVTPSCTQQCLSSYQLMLSECHMGPVGPILQRCENQQYANYVNCLSACQEPKSMLGAIVSDCDEQYQAALAACGPTNYLCRNHAMEEYIMCQGWKRVQSKASPSPSSSSSSSKVRSTGVSPCIYQCDDEYETALQNCAEKHPRSGFYCDVVANGVFSQCEQACTQM